MIRHVFSQKPDLIYYRMDFLRASILTKTFFDTYTFRWQLKLVNEFSTIEIGGIHGISRFIYCKSNN